MGRVNPIIPRRDVTLVLGKMSLFLAVKVSLRVAREEITKQKELSFSIFTLLGVCIILKFPTSIPVHSIWESLPRAADYHLTVALNIYFFIVMMDRILNTIKYCIK